MAIDTKQADKQQLDKNDAEKISLVDIEELRKALGAEANIGAYSPGLPINTECALTGSTCMCLQWWS
jgi:hypothetical protein